MAKALFHRHQRVWVEPVGTWAIIDKVNPIWVKGFDEPVKVSYDCGLGRDFSAEELRAKEDALEKKDDTAMHWRLMRARNKWHNPDDSPHHPHPGSYPVVVTDPNDWGGWRVPGAEYDRDPALIEMQARLIACAPKLLQLAKDLRTYVRQEIDSVSEDLIDLAKRADAMEKIIAPDVVSPTASAAPSLRKDGRAA
jgi:hypothetical protein